MCRNARFPALQRVKMHVFDVFRMYAIPGCIRDVRGKHARFPTLQRVKMHVFDVFRRFPTVECADRQMTRLNSGRKGSSYAVLRFSPLLPEVVVQALPTTPLAARTFLWVWSSKVQ